MSYPGGHRLRNRNFCGDFENAFRFHLTQSTGICCMQMKKLNILEERFH